MAGPVECGRIICDFPSHKQKKETVKIAGTAIRKESPSRDARGDNVLFKTVRSGEASVSLLQKQHLLRIRELLGADSIEIDTAGH